MINTNTTHNSYNDDTELVAGLPRWKPAPQTPKKTEAVKLKPAAVINRVTFECGCIHDIIPLGAFQEHRCQVITCKQHHDKILDISFAAHYARKEHR